MSKPLQLANVALLVAIGIHGADHLAQDRGLDSLTTEVRAGGAVVAVLALISLALTLRRHERAPHFALAIGLSVALGVVASHFAPHWSAFSDPYADASLPAISWAAAGLEVLAALVLAGVAFTRLRGQPTLVTG